MPHHRNSHDTYFQSNAGIWNQRVTFHKQSAFYDLENFKKGKKVLTDIELTELGPVSGKSLLHLQCHFGMDSMDWARQGAKVTGIDFSNEAIQLANELNRDLGLGVTFICCNVLDTSAHVTEQFDIVFTSYGVIGWLPVLDAWAAMIAERLRPGGIFYIAEFHPVVWMFDDAFTHIAYSYENREVIVTENKGTYTDRTADIRGKEYSWNHSLGEVINALTKAGLIIQFLNEYMYSPYPCFHSMTEYEPGKWHIRGLEGKIPMVYTIKALKQ